MPGWLIREALKSGSVWETENGWKPGNSSQKHLGDPDCPAEPRRVSDHLSADRQRQADNLALAGTIYGRRRRRPADVGAHLAGKPVALHHTIKSLVSAIIASAPEALASASRRATRSTASAPSARRSRLASSRRDCCTPFSPWGNRRRAARVKPLHAQPAASGRQLRIGSANHASSMQASRAKVITTVPS
jgi:hypothetical protein